MVKTNTMNPPPKTEILQTTTESLTPEQSASLNSGLADPSEAAPSITPEEPFQEPSTEPGVPSGTPQPGAEPQFTIDEGGPPSEPPEADPLKDTQRAFHQAREENAELRRILSAMVANKELAGQPAPPPTESISPEPTEEERLDPTRYVRRMIDMVENRRRDESSMLEMQNFVDAHPDWQDLHPRMQQIKAQEPWIAQGPGTLNRLYKRAKELEELEGYREAIKKSANTAMQAGVHMQKQKGGRPFVSPTGGGTISGKVTVPPDFATWPTDKQEQWLKQHGFWKEDSF